MGASTFMSWVFHRGLSSSPPSQKSLLPAWELGTGSMLAAQRPGDLQRAEAGKELMSQLVVICFEKMFILVYLKGSVTRGS